MTNYPIHGTIYAVDFIHQQLFMEHVDGSRTIIQPEVWRQDIYNDWCKEARIVFAIGAKAVDLPLLLSAKVKALDFDDAHTPIVKRDDELSRLFVQVMENAEPFTLYYHATTRAWHAEINRMPKDVITSQYGLDEAIHMALTMRKIQS